MLCAVLELLSVMVLCEEPGRVLVFDSALVEEADGVEVTLPFAPQPVSRTSESAITAARMIETIFFMLICSFCRYFSGNTPVSWSSEPQ